MRAMNRSMLTLTIAIAWCTASSAPGQNSPLGRPKRNFFDVHLLHSRDPALVGGTAYLWARDPFALYYAGQERVRRHYTRAEGAYSGSENPRLPLYSVREDDRG